MEVFVPNWAGKLFQDNNREISCLTKNRDFFTDKEELREYIERFGLKPTTQLPSPPKGRARRRESGGALPQQQVQNFFVILYTYVTRNISSFR